LENTGENSKAARAIHIAGLVHKVQEKESLSDQEQAELNEWRRETDHEDLFVQLNDRKSFIAEVKGMEEYNNTGEAVNVIFGRLGLKLPDQSRRISLLRRRLSVAAIFILAIAGVWLLVAKEKGAKSNASIVVSGNNITPGGNKAVLTLADGSKIVLDSAHNRQLAQQGNASVINQDGHVIYHAGGKEETVVYNTMATPRGGQYQLVLPDGTKVWLNAASSIKYPTAFAGKERKVELTGEAYFEVAKLAAGAPRTVKGNVPFIVSILSSSGNGEVEVLGTHFDVNAYGDEEMVKTTLLEGAVKLVRDNKSILLRPGQQAGYGNNGGPELLKDGDTEEALAWKNGVFLFNEASIETVMRQVERWYDIEVSYAGKIPAGHFSGTVNRNANISQVLKILELSDVHFRIEGRKIIVLPG
jgi:ferric-dicitrate binding protein FerR (iron transport regulator)